MAILSSYGMNHTRKRVDDGEVGGKKEEEEEEKMYDRQKGR